MRITGDDALKPRTTDADRQDAVVFDPLASFLALCAFLALSSNAFCASTAIPADPVVVARAKSCGSHQYANNDRPARGDYFADGQGSQARFLYPLGIAIDAHGTLYVADTGNRVVRRIAPDGTVTTLAGTPGRQGCSDGTGLQASFYEVRSIAVTNDATLLVPDAGTNTIRRITPTGQVSTLADQQEAPPAGALDTRILLKNNTPMGIAVDGSSAIYISLSNTIYKISPNSGATVLAGSATAQPFGTKEWVDQTANRNGMGATARFNSAYGITVDPQGTVYVTDSSLGVIKSIAPSGEVKTFAGVVYDHAFPQQTSIDGAAGQARFFVPEGIAVDGAGTVYVADRRNSTIRKITRAGLVSTLAGAPRQAGSQDGAGSAARFVSPTAVTADADGDLYVADSGDNTIRKVTADGVVTTVAGVSAYRERVKVVLNAPAARSPHDGSTIVDPAASATPPSAFTPAPHGLVAALGRLASQDNVISPPEVAEALNLPLDQFKWLNDDAGGWIKGVGAFDGTTIKSAELGYRRRLAADGTTSARPIKTPWRAAYVSLVINLRDRTCLSADEMAAELKTTGAPVRSPGDVANGSEKTVRSGVRFAISENGAITKVMLFDRTCARGISIYKSSFNGRDLPR
jgi:sugar lactone lactonase YvrE